MRSTNAGARRRARNARATGSHQVARANAQRSAAIAASAGEPGDRDRKAGQTRRTRPGASVGETNAERGSDASGARDRKRGAGARTKRDRAQRARAKRERPQNAGQTAQPQNGQTGADARTPFADRTVRKRRVGSAADAERADRKIEISRRHGGRLHDELLGDRRDDQGLEVHLVRAPGGSAKRECSDGVVRKGRKPRAESIDEAPGGLTNCSIRRRWTARCRHGYVLLLDVPPEGSEVPGAKRAATVSSYSGALSAFKMGRIGGAM